MDGKIIAGNYPNAKLKRSWGTVWICRAGFSSVSLKGQVQQVELVTEENKKKFAGSAGWGVVGLVALGPLGALAGVLAGGNKKEVCFVCTLKDGARFMAIADQKTYQALSADSFGSQVHSGSEVAENSGAVNFCSSCGTRLVVGGQFCTGCGSRV